MKIESKEKPEKSMKNLKMQFIVTGFSEATGFRIFAFEGIGADRSRVPFTVRADLAMARRYGIRLQELPLLCWALLDSAPEDTELRAFTYGEGEMSLHASAQQRALEEKASRRGGFRQATPAPSGDYLNTNRVWR
jgi:hypothetical protein